MKSTNTLLFGGLTILMVLSSCSIQKRQHLSGYHIDWKKANQSVEKEVTAKRKTSKSSEKDDIIASRDQSARADTAEDITQSKKFIASTDEHQIIFPEKKKPNFYTNKSKRIDSDNENQQATFRSELKQGARMILANDDEVNRKTNGFAIAGFVLSLAGLLFFGLGLGALAIVFSAISLKKIKDEPLKWEGKGLATAGLVIGIIDVAAWLIIIAIIIVLF
ncbi:MAG: DUF4190 domain-containing protein [Salibacteraceae bacterium]